MLRNVRRLSRENGLIFIMIPFFAFVFLKLFLGDVGGVAGLATTRHLLIRPKEVLVSPKSEGDNAAGNKVSVARS